MLKIGFACQICGYRDYKIKTCRLDKVSTDIIKTLTIENLQTLSRMLLYCKDNYIPMFRISSDIIPLGSHYANTWDWWRQEAKTFVALGEFILENEIRVSMHPGQYTVLNSPDENIVQRAVLDLLYHTRFLDAMNLPSSHKIILHIGGAYGDKKAALDRFIENAKRLPENIMNRLILENDEKLFAIEDVLYAANALHLPVVLDTLHFALNSSHEMDVKDYIKHCAATWKPQDGRQKIHYSQQRENARLGSHSLTIDVDKWLKDSTEWENLDVMLEVKDKNLSAIKCNAIINGCSRKALQREWARYKYLIMSHSQAHYEKLRSLFREEISPIVFYHLVDEALLITPTDKSIRNAAQHIWGYFKEKENSKQFFSILEKLEPELKASDRLFSYLYRLAKKYNELYLLDGYSFYRIEN